MSSDSTSTASELPSGASGAPEGDGYTVAPHPPLVSQVCLRCGAQVGSRSIHDAWHEAQDKALDDLEWRARGSRCPHA